MKYIFIIFIIIVENSKDNLIEKIYQKSKDFYVKILDIKNIFESINKKSYEKKYHILTSKTFYEAYESLFQNIRNFIICLWDNPKIFYNLMIYSDKNELQNNIIPLLINNFYENIFSSNILENQLVYICIIFIIEEINKINSLNDKNNFLENEIFDIFINELLKKVEIQSYFRFIIQDVINEINSKSYVNNMKDYDYISNGKINLDVLNIESNINNCINERVKENVLKKGKKGKLKIIPDNFFMVKKEEENIDIKKYFDDITLSVLEEKSSYENSTQNFKEFCLTQIKIMNYINKHNNMEIYSNQTLLKNIYRTSISTKILNVYQNYFSKVIHTLNILINKIQENITTIPSSLKVICKAIVLLVKKKFGDNLKITDSVFFCCRFFFNKILLSFIRYPQLLLNNSLYITEETLYNLEIISFIFNKFYSGNLFLQSESGGNLTPFNGYFLDKIPILYKIYEDIISIELPTNLQKLIISENFDSYIYKYNYFDEYKNEVLYHQSCCVSFIDILILLKTIYHNSEKILNSNDTFKKIYEQLINDKNSLNYILDKSLSMELSNFIFNKGKIQNEKDLYSISKTNIEYLVINRVLFNKKYLNSIKNKTSSFSYINLNDIENEENNSNFYSNKMKDALCEILYNIPYIDYMIKHKFLKNNSLNDFSLFLSDIKIYLKYLLQHKSINQIDSFLLFEFAINFLIQNISNLPEKYSQNNYELFISEIKNKINDSIKSLKFEKISQYYNNFSYFELKEEVYQKYLSKLTNIPIYSKIKRIIRQTPVFIKIKISHPNNNKYDNLLIEIKQSYSNAKKMKNSENIYIDNKKNIIVFKTIEDLSQKFSFGNDIDFYIEEYMEQSEDKDIFNYINKFNIGEKFLDFFNKDLRNILTENGILDNDDKTHVNKIVSKLYDYFLNYLYDSIYKYLPSSKDEEISLKIKKLAWTKLSHYILFNSNIYECLIQRIVDCFNRFEKAKIPSEKYFRFKEIIEISKIIPCKEKINYKYINNEIVLNPIILYGIIKSQPKTIISDMKYIVYFIQEKNKEIEYFFEFLFPSYLLYIKQLTHENLYGNISEDEFTLNCNNSILN